MMMSHLIFMMLSLIASTCCTILTVHDDSGIRKKVCIDKDANSISIMLRNYNCVRNHLDVKYHPAIENCWSNVAGYKDGIPKSDDDWFKFYCNHKYHFVYKYIADRCIIKHLYDEAESLKDVALIRSHKVKTFISLSSCRILSHRDHPLTPHVIKYRIEDIPKVSLTLESCDAKNDECIRNEKRAAKVISKLCVNQTNAYSVKLLNYLTFASDLNQAELLPKLKHCFKLVTGKDHEVTPSTPSQWWTYACKQDKYAITVSRVLVRCMHIVYNIQDKNIRSKSREHYSSFSESSHSYFFRENWDKERRQLICDQKDPKWIQSYVNSSFNCYVNHISSSESKNDKNSDDTIALTSALNYCFKVHQTNPNNLPIPKSDDEWIKFACQWKYEVLPVIETQSCLERMFNFGAPWIDDLVPISELNSPSNLPPVVTQCPWIKLMSREELEIHSHDAEHQSHRYYPYVRNAHEVIKVLDDKDYISHFDPCLPTSSNSSKSLLIDQKRCVHRIASFRNEMSILKECYTEMGIQKMPETDDEILKFHCDHKYSWMYEDTAVLCLIRKQKWNGHIIHEYQSCFPHDLDKVLLKSMEWYSLAVLYEGDVRLDVNGENEIMKNKICVGKDADSLASAKKEYQQLTSCHGTFFDSCWKSLIGTEFPASFDTFIQWYCSTSDPSSHILAVQLCNKLNYIILPFGSGKQCPHPEVGTNGDDAADADDDDYLILNPDHKISFPIMEQMDKVMKIAKVKSFDDICVKKNDTWIKKYMESSISCYEPMVKELADADHSWLMQYCWDKEFKGIPIPKTPEEWIKFACNSETAGQLRDDTKVQHCIKASLSLESVVVTDKKSPHYRYYDSMQNPFDEKPKCLNKGFWSIYALRQQEDEREAQAQQQQQKSVKKN